MQQTLLKNLLPKGAIQVQKTFGTEASFLKKINPSMQLLMCKDAKRCFLGEYPTLIDISLAYDATTPVIWLVPQLEDLCEYCGSREKLSKFQLKQCATIITNEFGYLKISEIMLFFYRFKAGRYGKFYGTVDPLLITNALYNTFLQERNDVYVRHEQQLREEREEKERQSCISWEEYCKRKQLSVLKTK